MTSTIARERTAMGRAFLSRPVSLAIEDGIIVEGGTVFDYGCGRGDDVRRLRQLGYDVTGWDPAFAADVVRSAADVVNLGYVVNVIEDLHERARTMRSAWALARRVLVVAARPEWEARGVAGIRHGDGIITSNGTFQRFYRQDELRAWIETTLGTTAVAAAPGIFYVFRHREDVQGYLARQTRRAGSRAGIRVADLLFERHRAILEPLEAFVRQHRRLPRPDELVDSKQLVDIFGSVRAGFALVRRITGAHQWADVDLGSRTRVSERRFEQHRELLEPLVAFVSERGRLPRPDEIPASDELGAEFGSVRAAFALIRRVTGPDQWAEIEARSRRDFLTYLALAAFGGRPRYSELPENLQYDVRDLFGNYKSACAQADRLLFAAGDRQEIDIACRSSTVGKLTPEALYIHVSGVGHLPPVLRVYEGCGRALTGTVDGATVLKLNRLKAQISYLRYPRFDDDPHPELATVVVARLGQLDVTFKDFRGSENPPVLHRKETFVADDYPHRAKFARLTAQEERKGLLDDPAGIGTRLLWESRVEARGLSIKGHRVITRTRSTGRDDPATSVPRV